MTGRVTVWITERGKTPITHQGTLRFCIIAAEESVRQAQQENRQVWVTVPQDTIAEHRAAITTYIADVLKEMRITDVPTPEIGWYVRGGVS